MFITTAQRTEIADLADDCDADRIVITQESLIGGGLRVSMEFEGLDADYLVERNGLVTELRSCERWNH